MGAVMERQPWTLLSSHFHSRLLASAVKSLSESGGGRCESGCACCDTAVYFIVM